MVQILKEYRKPSTSEKFGQAFSNLGQALGSSIPAYLQERQQRQFLQEENEAAKRLGVDISGIRDPKIRQEAVASALKGKYEQESQERKYKQRSDLLREVEGQQENSPFMEQLMGALPQIEEKLGFKLTPEQIQSVASQLGGNQQQSMGNGSNIRKEQDPFMKAKKYAAIGDPTLANIASKEAEMKERQRRSSPEFQREQQISKSQASADVKYNQELQEASKQHELKKKTLDRLEKLNEKGVTGKPYEKLLEKTGLVALTSEGRREFAADVKNLITDIRSILGAQFTGFEFQTILNAYPSADFSKEANAAIIKNLKEFQDIKSKEVQFAQDLKRMNGGKLPPDFQSMVNERVREYSMEKLPQIKENMRKIMDEEYGITPGNILMLDPSGEPLDVPPNEIERYESLGATLP